MKSQKANLNLSCSSWWIGERQSLNSRVGCAIEARWFECRCAGCFSWICAENSSGNLYVTPRIAAGGPERGSTCLAVLSPLSLLELSLFRSCTLLGHAMQRVYCLSNSFSRLYRSTASLFPMNSSAFQCWSPCARLPHLVQSIFVLN